MYLVIQLSNLPYFKLTIKFCVGPSWIEGPTLDISALEGSIGDKSWFFFWELVNQGARAVPGRRTWERWPKRWVTSRHPPPKRTDSSGSGYDCSACRRATRPRRSLGRHRASGSDWSPLLGSDKTESIILLEAPEALDATTLVEDQLGEGGAPQTGPHCLHGWVEGR
jgi:hypothetical protein